MSVCLHQVCNFLHLSTLSFHAASFVLKVVTFQIGILLCATCTQLLCLKKKKKKLQRNPQLLYKDLKFPASLLSFTLCIELFSFMLKLKSQLPILVLLQQMSLLNPVLSEHPTFRKPNQQGLWVQKNGYGQGGPDLGMLGFWRSPPYSMVLAALLCRAALSQCHAASVGKVMACLSHGEEINGSHYKGV